MYYSCGCNCGCDYDCGCNTVASSCCNCITTTSTTMIPCIGEPCDELYDCGCVIYNGPDLSCYGIKNGYSLCNILDVIMHQISDECTTTTTSTTSTTTAYPCLCNCLKYTNISNANYTVAWIVCVNIYNELTITPNQILQVCGSNPYIPNTGVTLEVGGLCIPADGICICNIPTTSTTSTSTTSTTTVAPCKCYHLIYDALTGPIIAFNYTNCSGVFTTGSIAPGDAYNICARQNTVNAPGVIVTDIGACDAGCTSTTSTTTQAPPEPSTTTSTSTTSTTSTSTSSTTTSTTAFPGFPCNCISFSNMGGTAAINYTDCNGDVIYGSISASTILTYCGSNPSSNSLEVIITNGPACVAEVCLSPVTSTTSTTSTSSTTSTTTVAPNLHTLCYDTGDCSIPCSDCSTF